jgi:hypothetical protein
MESKNSKKGFLDLIKVDGRFETVTKNHYDNVVVGTALKEVYRNGKLLIDESLETIRQRTNRS